MKLTKLLTTFFILIIFSNILIDASSTFNSGISYKVIGQYVVPKSLAFSPDGNWLSVSVVQPNGGTITTFQVSKNSTNSYELTNPKSSNLPTTSGSNEPFDIAYSPDGKSIVNSKNLPQIDLFQVTQPSTLFTLTSGQNYALPQNIDIAKAISFSHDGTILATSNYSTNSVTLFQVSKANNINTLINPIDYNITSISSMPFALAFSPDGNCLATANSDSSDITVFQVVKQNNIKVLQNPVAYNLAKGSIPTGITFSNDSSKIIISDRYSNSLIVFDVKQINGACTLSNSISFPLPSGSINPNSVCVSPDGNYLVTANIYSNDITVWQLTKVQNTLTLINAKSYPLPTGSTTPVKAVFSPDSKCIATANSGSGDVTTFNISQ